MHFLFIQRLLGILLMVFSVTLLPPALVALLYQDGQIQVFLTGTFLVLLLGCMMWLPVRHSREELRVRDGFLIVVLFWFVLGLAGAVPFMLADHPELSVTDAIFESFSGLTTTGATVITGLDDLPKSILYYRQQLQWLGGMGIIVLAVAIMPMLGVGGMQLYRAETPGPHKDAKLTPRITETAKALWYIYLGLTIACGVSYWMAGMSGFDAIGHSFSTVAIGGFSTHDHSIGYFQSSTIVVSGCFHWYDYRLYHGRLFRLAGISADHAVVRKFHRWLRRFYRRWHEGDSFCVVNKTGSPGNRAPDTPQCTTSGQGGFQAHARPCYRCRVGFLCGLCRKFCRYHAVSHGNWSGPGDRFFGGGCLHEQSWPRSGRGWRQLRGPQ
jgi:hypothetical protein